MGLFFDRSGRFCRFDLRRSNFPLIQHKSELYRVDRDEFCIMCSGGGVTIVIVGSVSISVLVRSGTILRNKF